jgi:hypothetical protein
MSTFSELPSISSNYNYAKCAVPLGQICCQIPSPDGNMGHRYVLQLSLHKKLQSCTYSTTDEARKKISTDLKSVDLYLKFEKDFCLMNLITIKLH